MRGGRGEEEILQPCPLIVLSAERWSSPALWDYTLIPRDHGKEIAQLQPPLATGAPHSSSSHHSDQLPSPLSFHFLNDRSEQLLHPHSVIHPTHKCFFFPPIPFLLASSVSSASPPPPLLLFPPSLHQNISVCSPKLCFLTR